MGCEPHGGANNGCSNGKSYGWTFECLKLSMTMVKEINYNNFKYEAFWDLIIFSKFQNISLDGKQCPHWFFKHNIGKFSKVKYQKWIQIVSF